MFVSFCPSFTGPEVPAWLQSWTWHDGDWYFRVCRRRRGRWVYDLQHPRELIRARACEPGTVGLRIQGTEVRRFVIHDLSRLGELLEPREVLGPMLGDGAAASQHAIYAHESEEGRLLLPAWLLINHLWVWSSRVLRALFMPNGLDLLIHSDSDKVLLSPDLIQGSLTKTAESRVRWLVASQDARESWASVLTNAYTGSINLTLPRASLHGWAWGARVRAGLLACELASVHVSFDVQEFRPVRIGKR